MESLNSSGPLLSKKRGEYLQITARFLPLLLLYVFVIIAAQTSTFRGDEGRYIMFADNLIRGHYSPQEKLYLWNGPGYPIVLMPFMFMKLPLVTAKLLNALFLFTAILYFYYTLRLYMRDRQALLFSYLLGMYYPFLRHIHQLLSEQLAVLLVCGFLYHFCKLHRSSNGSYRQILFASLYLGYFALTKVFFGYVILAGILLYLVLYVWKKRNTFKKAFLVYLFAMLICMPYLIYTYTLTGKIFYWGNSGGIALYLMSTPFDRGYGDWNVLQKHSREIYEGFENLSTVELDEEFKRRAVRNIINYPANYLKNWLANIGRFFFHYPLSYETQKLRTYFYLLPNMFLFVLSVLSTYPAYAGRKKIPFEIYSILVFFGISFAGSSFIFVLNRQFWPLVPVVGLWLSFIMYSFVRVETKG